MDFGKVENVELVDFALPPDDAITKRTLAGSKRGKKHPEIYIGCAKWGRPDWIGMIYPKGTKQADFLKQYVLHFNCIELNALFYQLFSKDIIAKWAAIAPDGFKFCPKFSNVITHIRRLKEARKDTDAFLDHVNVFGNKLGTSFIQLADNFLPRHAESVHKYLEALPRDFNVALELRHTDWFADTPVSRDTFQLMSELGISSVITDTSGRRDVLHMRLTTTTAFIRFVGNGLHPTDYKRIDDWIDRLSSWMKSGIETIYFFIHQHDELYSPMLCEYMINNINQKCHLNLKPPIIINPNRGSINFN